MEITEFGDQLECAKRYVAEFAESDEIDKTRRLVEWESPRVYEALRKSYAMGYIRAMGVTKIDALKSIEDELDHKRRLSKELEARWQELQSQISGVKRQISNLEDLRVAAVNGQWPTDIRPQE